MNQGHKQALLLPAGEFGKWSAVFVGQTDLLQQGAPVNSMWIQGSVEVERLPDFDPLQQGGLLKLHADAGLQGIFVPLGVQPQHKNLPTIGGSQPLKTLNGRRFPSAVGAHHPEDFSLGYLEREIIDGDD